MSEFTIAIVDDDAAIRRLVRLYLKRAGFDTLECTTGQEARQILTTQPWDLAFQWMPSCPVLGRKL